MFIITTSVRTSLYICSGAFTDTGCVVVIFSVNTNVSYHCVTNISNGIVEIVKTSFDFIDIKKRHTLKTCYKKDPNLGVHLYPAVKSFENCLENWKSRVSTYLDKY